MTLSGTGQKAGPTGDSVAEAVTELRAASTSEGDAWLDQPEPAERRFADVTRELVDVPLLQLRRFIRFVGTPPGLMTLMCVILSVALLAAGLSIARSSEDQERDLNQLLDHVEPMSYSALNLYTSLSIADTSATTGFVENRAGSPRVNTVKTGSPASCCGVASPRFGPGGGASAHQRQHGMAAPHARLAAGEKGRIVALLVPPFHQRDGLFVGEGAQFSLTP